MNATTIYLSKGPGESWREYLERVVPFEKRRGVLTRYDKLCREDITRDDRPLEIERTKERAAHHVLWEWGLLPSRREGDGL